MELKAGDVITVKEKSQSSPKFKELKDYGYYNSTVDQHRS